MKGFKLIVLLFTLVLTGTWPTTFAQAQTYGDGAAAYSLQQFERAFEIWLPLAEANDHKSQYRLGVLYQEGRGVEVDLAKAAYWFRAAGEAGHGRAAYMLGNMYATGTGVEEDPEEAFTWFLRSAKSGEARAQFHVAIEYLDDGVTQKNLLEAHIWFRRAAEGFAAGIDYDLAVEAGDKTFAALSDSERAEAARRLENPAVQGPDR